MCWGPEVSYLFAFSYCSWDSWGKNTGVACCSLFQWTMFVRSFFRTTAHNQICFCGSFNLAAGGLLKSFSGSFSLEWKIVKSSICWDFAFYKELKDIGMCITWGGTRTPPQGCTIVSQLLLPCLCTSSLLWLLLFPCSVVSEALWPHGLQHARLPCPSLLPELAQTHVRWVSDAFQQSRPLSITFSD